ncbi:hypothetical protein [Roseobacter sp. CCS2]|uniref:hypothetical protein n=1 Tax=Roseobacter sp. CCS2 TaxID=391593 RepID=UPI0000F3E462|nr:hypothetical protein [Roseobacter sp. CCS2]EBA11989.1 hypothetical protein RCCS2_11869 [Roseobacter sp. CCS2]
MDHLAPFRSRPTLHLPQFNQSGWQLKRYAILSQGHTYNDDVTTAATAKAMRLLPKAGSLVDADGNHGIGFQIIHFAQVAVVSPVFYWQWGSVLAHAGQVRASWDEPTLFHDGAKEVLGCVWEMDIVNFEVNVWKKHMLSDNKTPSQNLATYLDQSFDN